MAALLRLAEPTGKIYIDGINVLEIGLHELRNKISVIPQVGRLIQRLLQIPDKEFEFTSMKAHLSHFQRKLPLFAKVL